MIDLHLRADSEAELAEALPALRGVDDAGNPVWLTGSMHHAFEPGIPVVTTPAALDEAGTVTAPAALAPGWHANLRLASDHPDLLPLISAAEPFTVEPATPQRIFA